MDESRIKPTGDESLALLHRQPPCSTPKFDVGIIPYASARRSRTTTPGLRRAQIANRLELAKTLYLAVLLGSLALTLGCNSSAPESTAARKADSNFKVHFDAGLAITGQGGVYRIAIPSEYIASATDATQVHASCDCVEAKLFDYLDAARSKHCGLQLVVKPEPQASPMNLLLSIAITRNDGKLITVETQLQEVTSLE